MSVQKNTYVLCGMKYPFETFSEDQYERVFEPYMDSAFEGVKNHNGLAVIADGMSGKYVFIGRVLAKSGLFSDLPPTDCTVTNDLRIKVRDAIKRHLGAPASLSEIRVWTFTHCR